MKEFLCARLWLIYRQRWIVTLVVAGSLSLIVCLHGASGAEGRAYDVARNVFYSGSYELAEKEFADFIKDHPASDKIPEVVLLQAQCRYQLKKFDDALALLRARLVNAGKLADQYQYWIAESLFRKSDYAGAATAFAQVLSDFPGSSRRLDASLGEAYARFKLGDQQRTVDLLGQPNGAFQQAVENQIDDERAIRGHLLLGEAYLGLKQFQKGEETMTRLGGRNLSPELNWQRLYLLARLQLAQQQIDGALQTVTNLLSQLSTITNAAALNLQADAAALQGEVFEQKGMAESAVQAYERNLNTNVPSARRQQALQQIVKLTLAQNKIGEASKRLESFVAQNPKDSMLDLLRLTLGEVRLKEYYALPAATRRNATNLLHQARTQFEQIIANTNNQFAAKAQVDRGWCLWEEGQTGGSTNRITDSLIAFQAAAEQLPRSEEQAVARFKLADCQLNLASYAYALSNYWLVATNYADLPGVQSEMVGLALYQIVHASIQLGDLGSADQAVQKILADYPPGDSNDRSLLLYGQAKGHLNSPEEARQFFDRFIEKLPNSPELPKVELAVARTYELEGNWRMAADLYAHWLAKHADHVLRPDVEFDCARANDLAGNERNAFQLFTNFVAQFPTNQFAPRAQFWVATHFYRLGGTNYVKAEENFQKIYQNANWPQQTELCFQAMMMAGRAASKRQGYNDAVNYFTNLIDKLINLNPSSPLLPKAYFALADTYIVYPEAVPGSLNPVNSFKEAISVLDKITREYPTNALAPLAWGRMGDCYFQMASVDANNYEKAVSAYTQALTNNLADVSCRSIAEVHLAQVLEKQAGLASATGRTNLLAEALRHYLYVVEGKNLSENEVADPFWVKEAAVAAARLAEDQKRWNVATKLYLQLKELLPSLRKTWELQLEKMERIGSQIEPADN